VMLGVVFAVGSLVMYARLGEPMAWNANAQLQSLSKDSSSDEVSHGQSPQDLQEMDAVKQGLRISVNTQYALK